MNFYEIKLNMFFVIDHRPQYVYITDSMTVHFPSEILAKRVSN